MSTRIVTKNDYEAMLELFKAITLFTDDERLVIKELLETYLFNETQKDYIFYVSTSHDQLTAFICFGPTPMTSNTFDLYWVGTHPEYRRQGLAESLITVMKDYMKSQNAKIIRVETASQDLYAQTVAFYDRLGFMAEARLKDFYRDGDDLIIYTMRL